MGTEHWLPIECVMTAAWKESVCVYVCVITLSTPGWTRLALITTLAVNFTVIVDQVKKNVSSTAEARRKPGFQIIYCHPEISLGFRVSSLTFVDFCDLITPLLKSHTKLFFFNICIRSRLILGLANYWL